MEYSLCTAAFRFLSHATDKSGGKPSGTCRQLLLVSRTLHAALFASFVYPPSSGLRRLGLEVSDVRRLSNSLILSAVNQHVISKCLEWLRHQLALLLFIESHCSQLLRLFKRKDLEELSAHLKHSEMLAPSSVTSAGTLLRCIVGVLCLRPRQLAVSLAVDSLILIQTQLFRAYFSGCVFCTPTSVPLPSHLLSPAFNQVTTSLVVKLMYEYD